MKGKQFRLNVCCVLAVLAALAFCAPESQAAQGRFWMFSPQEEKAGGLCVAAQTQPNGDAVRLYRSANGRLSVGLRAQDASFTPQDPYRIDARAAGNITSFYANALSTHELLIPFDTLEGIAAADKFSLTLGNGILYEVEGFQTALSYMESCPSSGPGSDSPDNAMDKTQEITEKDDPAVQPAPAPSGETASIAPSDITETPSLPAKQGDSLLSETRHMPPGEPPLSALPPDETEDEDLATLAAAADPSLGTHALPPPPPPAALPDDIAVLPPVAAYTPGEMDEDSLQSSLIHKLQILEAEKESLRKELLSYQQGTLAQIQSCGTGSASPVPVDSSALPAQDRPSDEAQLSDYFRDMSLSTVLDPGQASE